jgi:glutamate synthase domain-containing protein 2
VRNISLEVTRFPTKEVTSYLQLPPPRTMEFWTRWKIEHIRKLAQTGRATTQVFPPNTERTSRILDRIFLKGRDSAAPPPSLFSKASSVKTKVNMRVPFVSDSKIELSTPLYLGDMSFGALSGIPNIAIACAAEKTGVIAGTGEGGLLGKVANCSRITVQWASARFGVDSETLSKGQAVVIKIGQGAKPGIGGHLPGAKVTEQISEVRRIPVGRDAISPAPHHDIYSIEDLGQRIVALREATNKPVLVKVGATNYIPYIACGIARMGASGIIIDGAGAGTGAAPSVVKDNVGIPIELAVASVDTALRREGFRDKFTVIAAGRVSTPEDSMKLIALGADITSLGTAALISLGCIMVHKCHLGYCPAVLTNKIGSNQAKILSLDQSIHWLCNLVQGWDEEMSLLLEYLGLSDIRELRGRRDFLRYSDRATRSLNSETLEVLGLSTDQHKDSPKTTNSNLRETHNPLQEAGFDPLRLWTPRRVGMLREMAGTIGKIPGEAEISSMGTTAPPVIEEPMRISDYLVSDGAQVTRPSIDPYREEIETATFLSGIELRLSSPFFFADLPNNVSSDVKSIFARVASTMGLVFDVKNPRKSDRVDFKRYEERIISDYTEHGSESCGIVCFSSQSYLNRNVIEHASKLRKEGKIVMLRCSSSREIVERLAQGLNDDIVKIFRGILLDEDEGSIPLEISISFLDRELRKGNLRNRVSIFAESNAIRGSDDIFKLLGLGADAVGFGVAGLQAIGYEEGTNVLFDLQKSIERLENFVLALQKDIKLLAGAAGISSVGSSLVGNRELLRAVDLDSEIRRQIDVKPAGAA